MNDALKSQNESSTEPNTQPVRTRRRWVTVLLVLVIFISGMIVGGGATIVVAVRNIQYAIKNPSVVPERATVRLQRALDLDEQQTVEVREVLSDLQRRLQQIRGRVYPEVQQELAEARSAISAVLDDEQKAAWDELFERVRERWFPPPPDGAVDTAAAVQ